MSRDLLIDNSAKELTLDFKFHVQYSRKIITIISLETFTGP